MEPTLINERFTVFFDKLLSLGRFSDYVKENLGYDDISTILYQDINPLDNIPITNWGLYCSDKKIIEVHENKFDFYHYPENKDESNVVFLNLLTTLFAEFRISAKRLAYAPTYTLQKDDFPNFCANNIQNYKFKNSLLQSFSLSKVFYLNENLDDYVFNMIYNVNISSQVSFFNPQERGKLLVSVDINTRDNGNSIFTTKQTILFFNSISSFNSAFLENIGLSEKKDA